MTLNKKKKQFSQTPEYQIICDQQAMTNMSCVTIKNLQDRRRVQQGHRTFQPAVQLPIISFFLFQSEATWM